MAKTIDFNSFDQPHINFKMRDEAGTIFRVTTPSEEFVEKLMATGKELKATLANEDEASLKAMWDFLAELFSNNLDGIKVTAEELKGKYGLKLADVFIVYKVYLEFIGEIQNAKN